jgi:hypothetical protein
MDDDKMEDAGERSEMPKPDRSTIEIFFDESHVQEIGLMGDLKDQREEIARLRRAATQANADEAEMDDAIRLAAREVLPDKCVCGDEYCVPDAADIVERLVREVRRLRLTDAERTEIQRLIEDYEQDGEPASDRCVATLRGLLTRTK